MTISKAHGRSTRTFRRIRARVLSESDTCIVCGHGGADTGGHLISRKDAPELAEDADNLAPIHGVDGCPTCARRCNNEMGSGTLAEVVQLNTSRDWFAA